MINPESGEAAGGGSGAEQLSASHQSERIAGALLGLACGDALGAPAEFKSKDEVQKKFGTLRDMVGGGAWDPGEWTDDTAMALCLADGILANPGDPVAEAGQRFLEWRKSAKDVGNNISAALSGFRGDWAEAARNTPGARSGRAGSNGSLMRTLPVALAYDDRDTMLLMSARLSGMTHWDAQAEVCCAVYCLWARHLLEGKPLPDGWHAALDEGRVLSQAGPLSADTPGPQPLPDGFWERLQGVERLKYEDLQASGYAGYVVECLEAAAWCCLHSDSLEECLVSAVNLAGEADTIAAVAGGIAGAHWGMSNIPSRWLEKLHERERLERTARDLGYLRRHLRMYDSPMLRSRPLTFDWVTDRIAAGRNPLSSRDIRILAAQGVTHFLDLRQPHEWSAPKYGEDALQEIERSGLQRLHLEVVDMGAPTPQALDAACAFIDASLADPRAKVYVHCRAGMERTAAVLIAYYARQQGLSYDAALQELRKTRPIFAPMSGQEQAVRKWLAGRAP